MPDIEILNILTINYNATGTKETDRDANCNKTQPSPRVQEVSHAIQIQGKKLVGLEDAIQTQTIIQI